MTSETYTRFFLFDGVGPADGEMYADRQQLIDMVGYYGEPDLVVLAFDHRALTSGKAELVDVTEEIAHEWWNDAGEADTRESIRAGEKICFLAKRFYDREVGIWERDAYAAENAADYWRDMRAVG